MNFTRQNILRCDYKIALSETRGRESITTTAAQVEYQRPMRFTQLN